VLSFAGLRLVIVEGADAWKAADAAPLVAYLDRPNPGTCLALVASASPAPRLAAAVAAAGDVLHFGPDPKEKGARRTQWFVEHLGKEVSRAGGSPRWRAGQWTGCSSTAPTPAAPGSPPWS
jgi:hypothetical protein